MKKLIVVLVLIGIFLFAIGCKKEERVVYPAAAAMAKASIATEERGSTPAEAQEDAAAVEEKKALDEEKLVVYHPEVRVSAGELSWLIIDNDTLTYDNEGSNKHEMSITWEMQNNISYIRLHDRPSYLFKNDTSGKDRFLILYCGDYAYNNDPEFVSIYRTNKEYVGIIRLYNSNNKLAETYIDRWLRNYACSRISTIEATSELQEKGFVYKAENMLSVELLPWATSKNGGIGEKIRVSLKELESYGFWVDMHREKFTYRGIIISSGYVDYNRPYLYEENSRPKKIRVTYGDDYYIDIELEDTPQFQLIDFDDSIKANARHYVEIEILEVYKGSKYNDLCINQIIPLSTIYIDGDKL